ncbi:MAG: GLUG motif-containing protein, partial [Bacillota bacterium]
MEGAGTKQDPYLVATAEDLMAVEKDPLAYYRQVKDIDLAYYPNWRPLCDGSMEYITGTGWVYKDYPFFGLYDGDDYSIKNLSINRVDYGGSGLFSQLAGGAVLKNIRLVDCRLRVIWESGCLVGALTPWDYEPGRPERIVVENCSVTGAEINIEERESYIGGIIGFAGNGWYPIDLVDLSFEGSIFGDYETSFIGGIAGYISPYEYEPYYGPITVDNCHVKADIIAGEDGRYIGGIVGYTDSDSDEHEIIKDCSFRGKLVGDESVGGIIGFGGRFIENCHSTGEIITKTGNAGGIMGESGYSYSHLKNCYSRCKIQVSEQKSIYYGAGGLVGSQWYGSISNCYAAGPVEADLSAGSGGLVGYLDEDTTVKSCYYDREVSGQSDSGKGEPKSTTEMKKRGTYEGWDFESLWVIEPPHNAGYPFFYGYGDGFDLYLAPNEFYFIEPPAVESYPPQATSVTVKSPTAEYTAELENVSVDMKKEKYYEIDSGNYEVCRQIATEMLEYLSVERKAINGKTRINQG